MYIITIFVITILIPTVQLIRPTIKLTFTPDEQYMPQRQDITIQCEVVNSAERMEPPQLWYVDLKTGKRTPISRSLLTTPTDDVPDTFKNNRNKRYEFVKKNHIRIRNLIMEDSAKYECDCPDCEEILTKQSKDLTVMKLVEPSWIIEPGWPLHENTKATIKCQTIDFYPYVGHKILRNQYEITNIGKSSLSKDNAFPQKFTWEANVTPTAEWHNTVLTCTIREGSTEQSISKTLDVLFTPNFLKCSERQYVDPKKDQSTIECSYTGNPRPELTWYRQLDQKSLTSNNGIKIDIKDEQQGKYRSIVTFDRNKLISIPLLTTNTSGENYYQQLLTKGFSVKLTVNGNDKGTRLINIVGDASQIQSKLLNSSITISLSSMLLICLLIYHIIQR